MLNRLFNKLNFHNKLFHYDREWYYYTISSQYDYLDRLYKNNLKVKENLISDVKIGFGVNLDFGLSSSQIKKKLGRPHFKYQKKDVDNYYISFYKRKIYKHKIKLEIHFLNDTFFLGVYIFNDDPKEFSNIVSELCMKYKVDPLNFIHTEHQITDSKNNIIDVNIKTNLVIAYIDNSNHKIHSIYKALNISEDEIARKQNHEKKRFRSFL